MDNLNQKLVFIIWKELFEARKNAILDKLFNII